MTTTPPPEAPARPVAPGLYVASGVLGILGFLACGAGCVWGLLTTPGNGMGEDYFHWMWWSGVGLMVGVPLLVLFLVFALAAAVTDQASSSIR